jgi:uncharacterized protein (DUF342 family)
LAEQNSAEVLSKDGWFRVRLSANKMEASLTLEAPVGDGKWPTKDDALKTLQTQNVVYGVMDGVVANLTKQRLPETVIVARGKPAEPGRDAEIKLLFETGVMRKFINDDDDDDDSAKVDYRDVQTLQNVTPGQVIGEKIPSTQGIPGWNVCGREIFPVNGKDKAVRLGKNVYWSEDGLKIISKIAGEPGSVHNQINVNPVHEIRGDVNFNSGNIAFLGSLVIHGNVDSGFRVEAEGDITIMGSVEAADLKAKGNIMIRGGVTGRDKSNISCGGEFTAKYLEHAKIDCGGSVIAKEAIMHCEINADGNVIAETGKGLIVGGVVRVGGVISAKSIGSKFGTATELEAGIKPNLKIESEQLEVALKDHNENLKKAEQAVALLERIPHLPPNRRVMYDNLLGTVVALKEQIAQTEARLKEITEEIVILSKSRGCVKVKETLYPGVRVSIGGSNSIIRDEYKYVLLVYNEGEVQVQAFR